MSRLVPRPVFRRIVYPLWSWKDGNYPFRHLRALERSQWQTPEEIRALQWRRLSRILSHAYGTSPYYRERWDAEGVHPSDIRSLEDLPAIPLLSKADIQAHAPSMCSTKIPSSRLIENRTGGSTGEPLVFHLDRERVRSRNAATIRHNRWAGLDIGTPHAVVWGHPGDVGSATGRWWSRFKDRSLFGMRMLDTSYLTRDLLDAFLDDLRRDPPHVLVGYANSMALLADHIRRTEAPVPPVHAVITSAEFLEASRRELIEEVFSCRVFDRYGCRETSVIASECDAHDGLHVNAEGLVVEMLHGARAAKPGEPGEVVVTDLLNVGMPLIRYRIRDLASPVPGDCACGRGLPRIRMIGGRISEFLTTPEGGIVSGTALIVPLVTRTPGIRHAQFFQDAKDHVVVRVVPGPDFGDSVREAFHAAARRALGGSVEVDIEVVDDIPLSSSGKHRYCISMIDPLS